MDGEVPPLVISEGNHMSADLDLISHVFFLSWLINVFMWKMLVFLQNVKIYDSLLVLCYSSPHTSGGYLHTGISLILLGLRQEAKDSVSFSSNNIGPTHRLFSICI